MLRAASRVQFTGVGLCLPVTSDCHAEAWRGISVIVGPEPPPIVGVTVEAYLLIGESHALPNSLISNL